MARVLPGARRFSAVLVLGIALTVPGVRSAQALTACGNILSDTTWTAANNPVSLTCDVTVYPGVTLTIDPGVNVVATPSFSLRVRGLLIVAGSASQPVGFTSASPPTKWGGISFETTQGGRGTISFAQISHANTGTSVQCCWGANPPATILDSTYSNNAVAIGGYSGNRIEIRRSTFTSNTQALNTADKNVFDSNFSFNGCGLCMVERTDVYSSAFSNNTTAISAYQSTSVRNSTITNNSTGVDDALSGITLTKNTITGNATGIVIGNASWVTRAYNNIHSNSIYNVRVNGSSNIPMANNYWGTTNTALIDAGIRDGNDQGGLGLVQYLPVLTQAVTLDTTPPETTITSAPPALTNSTTATFEFASSETPATFECSLDFAPWVQCVSPNTYAGLADGPNGFRVRATDNDMNTDQTPATYSFTVDTAAPDTTITSGPSGTTTGASVEFGFASDDPGATFLCALDGAAPALCWSPAALSDLAHGRHVFEVSAVDSAGNVDPTPARRVWTVDATAPVVEIVEPRAPGVYAQGARVPVGGDMPVIAGPVGVAASASDLGSGLADVVLEVDGVPVGSGTYDPEANVFRWTVAVPPGAHELVVRAIDQVGLTATASIEILVIAP